MARTGLLAGYLAPDRAHSLAREEGFGAHAVGLVQQSRRHRLRQFTQRRRRVRLTHLGVEFGDPRANAQLQLIANAREKEQALGSAAGSFDEIAKAQDAWRNILVPYTFIESGAAFNSQMIAGCTNPGTVTPNIGSGSVPRSSAMAQMIASTPR